MARDCLIIRATSMSHEVKALVESLSCYFGRHIYILVDQYDDESLDFYSGELGEIYIGRKFLNRKELPYFRKVGWQCGDYILYAAVDFFPYYDYYWMVEPDVVITINDKQSFFWSLSNLDCDFVGSNFGKRTDKWWWYKTIAPHTNGYVYGSCFPISRFSYESMKFLLEMRQKYFQDALRVVDLSEAGASRLIANDESFVATTLANANFTCESLTKLYPRIMSSFSANVPIHVDELKFLPERIVHPVCGDAIFANKFNRLSKSNVRISIERINEMSSRLGDERWLTIPGLISPAELAARAEITNQSKGI